MKSHDVLRKVGWFEDRDITHSFEVRIVAGQDGEALLTRTSDDHRIVGEESSFLSHGLRIPDNSLIHRQLPWSGWFFKVSVLGNPLPLFRGKLYALFFVEGCQRPGYTLSFLSRCELLSDEFL